MSYPINQTNGTVITTLLDGTTNTQTGITLIGRNYISYGEIQNENFIHLLENFAANTNPAVTRGAIAPLKGTLWYDTKTRVMRVYDSVNWYPVSQRVSSDTDPVTYGYTVGQGDQWYNTVTQQLSNWNGTNWDLVGPAYTAQQGKSGTFVESVTDTSANTHLVINTYSGNTLISTASADFPFITTDPLYDNINTGIIPTGIAAGNIIVHDLLSVHGQLNVLGSNLVVEGTSLLRNVFPQYTGLYDLGKPNNRFQNVFLNGQIDFANANISYTNNTLTLTSLGNINLSVGANTALHVDNTTALITVIGDPVKPYHVATKHYIDTNLDQILVTIQQNQDVFYANIKTIETELLANVNAIDANIASTNANVAAANAAIISGNIGMKAYVDSINFVLTANATSQQQQITNTKNYIDSLVPNFANIASPTFTGTPTAPAPQALTSYLNALNTLNYNYQLNSPVTITAGDYINQRDPNTYAVISNVQSTQTTIDSNINVKLISGTVNTTNNNILVTLNQSLTPQPAVHVIGFTPTGTQPAYLGLGDTSNRISTTAYVDITANILYGDYTQRISTAISSLNGLVNTGLNLKANINSPDLTGFPTAPEPPFGNSSSLIATTAFVANTVSAQRFPYTVSTTAPKSSDGSNGDFWFQTN
jgi:hypothetical protein